MAVRLHALMTVGLTAILVGGCSMIPFGRHGERERPPEPLAAAPAGSVTGMSLPPPPGTATDQLPPAGATAEAPSGLAALNPSQPSATVQPAPAPIGGDQLGRTDLLGGWTITSATDSCQLFMTLTTWAGGYRASTRNCSSAALQTISAWNMDGNQVQLLNDAGTTVARLYPSSKTQFSGQTAGGGPISVSR